jgi:hypothetical protein
VSDEIEPGLNNQSLAPGQVKRCMSQDHAAKRVRENLERMRERLVNKQVLPFFSTVLYAINCDQHQKENIPHASHVDLVTTSLEELKPDGLVQVIAATEALLMQLKARQG